MSSFINEINFIIETKNKILEYENKITEINKIIINLVKNKKENIDKINSSLLIKMNYECHLEFYKNKIKKLNKKSTYLLDLYKHYKLYKSIKVIKSKL